jgi:hypothetical protein
VSILRRLDAWIARQVCARRGHAWQPTRTIPPLSRAHYEDRCARCGEWRSGTAPHFTMDLGGE